MRLHRLEVSALGPFASTQTVDLDRLGADGLFLLHGETGAGKTSVLDAIAYALFNVVPGVRQRAGRLRCDQAPADLATSVRLELTLAGRRVRILRTAEWQRPKVRGDGTTKQPATALLEEWRDQEWVGLSIRIDEISHQLLDWIGMSAEQFFQVVLLPQGEFARFLMAESKDREQLLEKLFGTQRFADVQDWLAGRRAECNVRVEAIESVQRRHLARMCQEVALPDGTEPDLAQADATWRADQVGVTEQVAAAAQDVIGPAAAELLAARAESERMAGQRRLQLLRIEAEQEARTLAAAAALVQSRRAELAAARRAAPVEPLLAVLAAAECERDRMSEELARTLAPVAALLARPGDLPVRADGRKPAPDLTAAAELTCWERELRAECTRLAELEPLAAEYADRRSQAGQAERELATLTEHRGQARMRVAQLDEDLAGAGQQERDAAAAQAQLPGQRAAHAALSTALQAARSAAGAQVAVDAAAAGYRDAVDAHQEATDDVQRLRAERLAGIAAEIAAGLRSGEACPVCGSCAHPTPAQPTHPPVGAVDERRATDRQERAAASRAASQELWQRACSDHAGHLARCDGRAESELAPLVTAKEHELADVELIAAGGPAAAERLAALRDERERLRSLLADSAGDAELWTERAEQARRQAAALLGRLDAARGSASSLAERRAEVGAAAELLGQLLEALRSDRAARAAVDAATGRAQQQAGAAGFGDITAARAAQRSPSVLEEWEREIAGFERREAVLARLLAEPGLSEPDVIASAAQPPLDLAAGDPALHAAEDAHTAAVGAATAARRRAAEVARLAGRLAAAEAEAEPVRREHAEVRALADLVAGLGQNERRTTLRAYVLAARLADVAQAASVRLRQMSSGRYTFEHSGTADSARVRAGLGLVVVDDFSGLTRSTKTLSGGETFLASLALALGLADVVTAESGGTRLETLFIDEGFGSLDAEALDQVMSTLDELRAGGRVIGVVSHVEEMRSRIPSRLHVRKRRDGSVLEQVSA